jgi:hypothetical protein
MVNDKRFLQPPVIDIVKAVSAKEHKYDLPYYYLGHLINTNVKYTPFGSTQTALGKSNGYQHLWKEAEGKPVNGLFQFSWVNKERFYSITSAVDSSSNILFTRIGANDPNFNLRHDAGVMISGRGANFTAASAIEPHGMYDEVREYTSGVYGQIEKVTILQSSADYTVVRVTGKEHINWLFIINNGTADEKKQHSLAVEGKTITWTGNYYFSN